MKKGFALSICLGALFIGACERHPWEDEDGRMGTKRLFEHADAHGDEKKGGHDKKEISEKKKD